MMIFDQSLCNGNAAAIRAMNAQYQQVNAQRDDHRHALPLDMFVNTGTKPLDLFREWDNQTIQQFRLDEGDNILNRLLPLSMSVNIGRTILEGARSSDAGNFTQSMSGEEGSRFDNVDYDRQKTIIPIGQNGFKRNWREGVQLSLEDFNDAAIQQSEATRTHRQGVIGSFMDGHKNKDGQFIKEDGADWQGVRADSRVDQIDLGAGGLNVDLTSSATSGADIFNAFVEMARIRAVDNKVAASAVYFVSPTIMFNFVRDFSTTFSGKSINNKLLEIVGIAGIEMSSVLVGNQVLSIPFNTNFIQPLVGMGVSTIALPRPTWNSPFAFEVVSAIGWNVKNDFGSTNKALQYASS
jgi:hypothetical protein